MKVRFPVLTLTLASIAIAVQLIPGATVAWEFDRAGLAHGEVWRCLTCHFTHFDRNHLVWDVGVLLAFGTICEQTSRLHCAAALASAAGAISAALWWWQPQFAFYRGFSGLDCALFGLFVGWLTRRPPRSARLVGVLGLLAAVAKTSLEVATGATVFASGAGYVPVPLAHLVGLLTGVTVALLHRASGPTSPLRTAGSPSP